MDVGRRKGWSAMRRVLMPVLAAGLLAIAAFAPAAAQDTVTIDIREVDGSGQFGSADITTDGEQTIVALDIVPGDEGVPQPATSTKVPAPISAM